MSKWTLSAFGHLSGRYDTLFFFLLIFSDITVKHGKEKDTSSIQIIKRHASKLNSETNETITKQ